VGQMIRPDCEGVTADRALVVIEVTELVDPDAIGAGYPVPLPTDATRRMSEHLFTAAVPPATT